MAKKPQTTVQSNLVDASVGNGVALQSTPPNALLNGNGEMVADRKKDTRSAFEKAIDRYRNHGVTYGVGIEKANGAIAAFFGDLAADVTNGTIKVDHRDKVLKEFLDGAEADGREPIAQSTRGKLQSQVSAVLAASNLGLDFPATLSKLAKMRNEWKKQELGVKQLSEAIYTAANLQRTKSHSTTALTDDQIADCIRNYDAGTKADKAENTAATFVKKLKGISEMMEKLFNKLELDEQRKVVSTFHGGKPWKALIANEGGENVVPFQAPAAAPQPSMADMMAMFQKFAAGQ